MSQEVTYAKKIHISETKTIAILLIIFYHCMLFYGSESAHWPLSTGISSPMLMPLISLLKVCLVPSLVLCSGFLFLLSTKNHPRTKFGMLKNRAKRLVLTYFIYGALWLVPLYTFFDIRTWCRPLHMDFISGFILMGIGVFTDHLWFLWPLFWVSLFFIIIRNLLDGKKLILVGALTILAAISFESILSGVSYYCIRESGPFFIIFYAGILLYYFNENIEKWDSKTYYMIALGLLGLLLLTDYFNLERNVIHYIKELFGALLFYFIFMGFSRTSFSDKLNQSRFYRFCESHSINIYLLGCPFMQIYFRMIYPIIGTNVLLTVLCLCILSYVSIFIVVWVQDKLKKGLINKIPISN